MNHREQNLLHQTAGDEPPTLCLRTRMRVDTGRWLRNSPVWLCLVGEQLVALAAGRRDRTQVLPAADCTASSYCAASGQLILAPAKASSWQRLDLSPTDALLILSAIKTAHATAAAG